MADARTTKRLAVIEKYSYPVAAGIEVNMIETYSRLARQGWDVTFHASKDTLTEKNILADFEDHRGIKIRRYRYTLLGYFPDFDWDNVDFVCLHNFNVLPHFSVLIRTLIRKWVGRKKFALILTPHGGFNPEWSVFPWWTAWIKSFYHFTVGTFLINRVVDGVRAVSEWEKQEMVKKGVRASLVRVITNGLEDEAFLDVEKEASQAIKEQVKGYGRYIIQVGRVYWIKNYETTLRALALLPPEVKYVIVGPPADRKYTAYLEHMMHDLGLQGRVIFTGVVRGVDKYYLIKKAEMMVHMALWESFCNVVHEGMSQGLVCIVANNTALPLLVQDGENGYCLPTKDHVLLAAKIRFVLDNQDSATIKTIKQKSLLFGKSNSWGEVAERMKSFYLETLETVSKLPAEITQANGRSQN